MKKYGFTLIELLAVIVVLAIIALITTPMIMNVIEKSKKGALEDSAYGLIDSANIYYANNMLEGTLEQVDFTFVDGEQTSEAKLSYKGEVENGSVKLFSDSKVALCITEGKYSAIKNVNDDKVKVTTGGCEYNEETNTYETVDKVAEELATLKSLGNATSEDILEGKTAVVQGELVTGTMKSNSGTVATGTISIHNTYNYKVELGFRPVYINILVILNGAFRSTNIYDERIDTGIHKIGSDTNQTVGLPLTAKEAIYDTGFKVNSGYNYPGWELHYIAFKEFPE